MVTNTPVGYDVVAHESISTGETVAVLAGYVITTEQLGDLEPWQHSRTLQVSDDHFLVSVLKDDPPDLINHSCEPNLGFCGGTLLVARRPIAPGDRLTFDYAMCDSVPYDEFECHCGAPSCRGWVRADDWKLKRLQASYGDHFSSYLLVKIVAEQSDRPSRPVSV